MIGLAPAVFSPELSVIPPRIFLCDVSVSTRNLAIKKGGMTFRQHGRQTDSWKRKDEVGIMDAKYNWMIDNPYFRVAINSTLFALWFWGAFALLKF